MTAISLSAGFHSLDRGRAVTRVLVRDPLLTLSVAVLVIVAVCAVAAPWIAPYDPNTPDLANRLAPPFAPRPGVSFLGADPLGRDMLSRLIYGSRISVSVALLAVLISGTIGVLLGMISGLREGGASTVIMRAADVQFSIPSLVLALAIVAVIGPGVVNMIFVLAISAWVSYARVMRAEVLVAREREYMLAARGLGASTRWLVRRHLLPNTFGAVAVIATISMAYMMITEASLSFLGLGVPPGTADWGAMISDGRNYLYKGWWVSGFPGIAIIITVVALNIVGDWLNDRANPALQTW